MNSALIIANILGGVIFLLNIISNAKLTTKKVYIYNALCNGLSIIQYLLLSAWTGVICCIIAVVRNIVFALFKKEVPFVVLAIYIVLVLLLNYKLVNSVIDIVPIINITIYAVALWTKKIRNIKVVGIITCATGIIYALLVKS